MGSNGRDCGAGMTRRAFLGAGASCYAHLLLAAGVPAGFHKYEWDTTGRTVAQEPWGRLESLGEGLWALISTPLTGDRTTLCNGGIIAGSHGTLMVESYASADGARWMAERARELTGRWPTHVVLTHFHGDHTNGLEGCAEVSSPAIMTTDTTRRLVEEADAARGIEPASQRRQMLADVDVLDPTSVSEVELGGRTVRVVPRAGHTPSDVTVELEEPGVVWCGDLVWNHMFPNYRDATPSRLSRDVRALVRSNDTTYVPGHGSLAGMADLQRYVQLIDHVEETARLARQRGIPATEAAETFRVPDSLGEWTMFSPRYYEVALLAWEKELGGF